MSKRKTKLIIIFFWILVFSLCSFVLAQERELEVEYPEISGIKPETVAIGLPEYAKYIFNFSIIILGLVVLGALIRGGVNYLISAGQPAKLREARDQIVSALLGVVILLSSYLILTTINPELVIFRGPGMPLVEVPYCENDEQCLDRPGCRITDPDTGEEKNICYCDVETRMCRAKYEQGETRVIALEIPLGQMLAEEGIWDEELITQTKNLLEDFENFLKEEVTVNPTFNRISDLNKYLETLTDDCRCSALTPLSTPAASGARGIDCTGDPCKDKREQIDKIRDINTEKMKKLEEFKGKINKQLQIFNERADAFLNADEEMQECLAGGRILTLTEFLANITFYEELLGGKIEIRRNPSYPTAHADPFTFYCLKGGTILDMPISPLDVPTDIQEEFIPREEEPTATEPFYCPAMIPIGELINNVAFEALQATDNLEALVSYIDALLGELRNMETSVSKCAKENCQILSSGSLVNPCYMGVCGCIPVCPGDPPYPNPCYPNPLGPTPLCLIRSYQGPAICIPKEFDAPYHGSPCPRDDIEELVGSAENPKEKPGKIKENEDWIFKTIEDLKTSFATPPYVLEGPTEAENLDLLEGVRAAAKFCFSDNIEEPTWSLFDCITAIGNEGPDGNIIADCHPQTFFCCTGDKSEADKARTVLPRETRDRRVTTYYQPPIALTGDCQEDIIIQASSYAGIRYSQGRQKDPADCRPWNRAHCYPTAPGFGPEGVGCVDCSGLASRVYRDLGLLPTEPLLTPQGWCFNSRSLSLSPYLYKVPIENAQKGDLVWIPGHVSIFKEGHINGVYKVWESGGACSGDRVCESTYDRGPGGWARKYREIKIYRAKNPCGTFRPYQ